MSPEKQLQVITEGRIWQSVREQLGGDLSRRNELFTISQAEFDAWADSIELLHGTVYNTPHTWDGIYVLQERDRWVVFVQERGCRIHGCGDFGDYTLAKRQALSTQYLYAITLPTA